MRAPGCCGRAMLGLRQTDYARIWWCLRCGSHCHQLKDESPGSLITPSGLTAAAAALERMADGVDSGSVHYVQIPDGLRRLAATIGPL